MREAALWVLGAMALIMLVALLSYSRLDPGFSHTGDGAPLRNQIGAIGAWFADVAFSLFGAPAIAVPRHGACWPGGSSSLRVPALNPLTAGC